jgi:hypothetical protein
MRRGEIFWGALLVILGVLFWLKTAGYLPGDVLGWFWPLFVIAAGIWILVGSRSHPGRGQPDASFSVPLQDAQEASLRIDHGAGRVSIGAGASSGDFLTGARGVGMNQSVQRSGRRLDVKIEAGPSFIPFLGPEGGVWQYQLSSAIPTTIDIHAGASRLDLDFTELQVTRFSFQGGASNLNLTLPARVDNTLIEVDAGAASIELRVPQGVSLRLRYKSVGSLSVDEGVFTRRDDGLYQSADYDTGSHRADVTIGGGATSLRVVQEAT